MMLYRASVGSLKTTSSYCHEWTGTTSMLGPPSLLDVSVSGTMRLFFVVHGWSLRRWCTVMIFSEASATKKILIWISNSPHPVSVTSKGGLSMTVSERMVQVGDTEIHKDIESASSSRETPSMVSG